MSTQSARILLEVVAGILPGTPEPEFTKRWAITSALWERLIDAKTEALADDVVKEIEAIYDEAQKYAASLRDPRRLNWVRLDWLYL